MTAASIPTGSEVLRPAQVTGRRILFGVDPAVDGGVVAVWVYRDKSGRLFMQARSAETVFYRPQEWVHPEDGEVL